MAKKWIFGGIVLSGIVAAILRKRKSGYDWDEIDSAGGDTFGERSPQSPEQKMSEAKTEHNVTPEELGTASRVETSFPDIEKAWPGITLDEILIAEGDLDELAQLIADKTSQPTEAVRKRLDEIIGQDAPEGVYPAH